MSDKDKQDDIAAADLSEAETERDTAAPETSEAVTAPDTVADDAAVSGDAGDNTAAPRPSRMPLAISSLALIVALVAVAATAFMWLGERGRDDAATAGVQNALQDLNDALHNNRQQLSALGNRDSELESNIENSIERTERLLQQQQRAFEALPGRLSAVEASLAALQGISAGVRDTWTLAEAEYFMEIANAQLNLARNPELALAALELADERIAKLAAPGLTDVRRALANELRALESLEAPDIEGAALTLASLAGTVESLPLREVIVPPGQRPVDVADELSGMERALASLKSAMSDVVSVRRTDQPVTPLLPPDAVYFLRTNLKLQLQAARLALLQNEQALFEQSLDDAAAWLQEYFDPETTPVSSTLETINELRASRFSLMRIDIGRSLTLLRRYVALQASERDAAAGAEQ